MPRLALGRIALGALVALAMAVAFGGALGCVKNAYYQRGDHNYAAFEEPQHSGECAQASQCVVSGCNNERCTAPAEAGPSACGIVQGLPAGRCGCLEGVCVWHSGR